MHREDVQGWCLGRDAQGTPTLSECALMRGVEGRYFAVMNDREGNPLTVRTYQRGETFFEDKRAALREMISQIDALKARHQAVLSYLAEQRFVAEQALQLEQALELEREAEDAGH